MSLAYTYYQDVLFNGQDLTEIPYVKIFSLPGLINEPEPFVYSGKLTRRHGVALYGKDYGSKEFMIEGLINAPDRATFLSTKESLLRYLQPVEATLRVPFDNNPVEYTATLDNIMFSDAGGGYAKFSISFICSDPFGYDRDARTILNGSSTSNATNDFTLSEAIGGAYATPATITITLSSVSGGTAKYIDISNPNGDAIRVTTDWASDDVLAIDMKAKTVKINGTATDYTGAFWEFSVGDTTLTYATSITTATAHVTATYKRRRV